MNSTGLVHSWNVNLSELGPIYPFVGWEGTMLAVCAAMCVAFMIWKFATETAKYAERVEELRAPGALAAALAADRRHHHPTAEQSVID